MYPNPLRPGTPVCHYFTREWKEMGYEVVVIHFRSMFPAIYTMGAKLFPRLAKRYVGNHVEMDRNMKMVKSDQDGIPVFSLPIHKFFPHGKYTSNVINKKVMEIENLLKGEGYVPDVIIGHFYNPQLEVIAKLKDIFPNAKTCVSLHEEGEVVKALLGKQSDKVLNAIDIIGFRSVPIQKSFEEVFGSQHKSLLCWSGTPEFFLNTPSVKDRVFTDGPVHGFIYVGQTIKRKYPKQTVEGVHIAMGDYPYKLVYVGSKDMGYPETQEYVMQHHLENKVLFTGKIPRDEIIRYYDESDVFIMISRGEVFGLVYLEAMSRGCITIAGKGEGMEGIIEHGINGFLCEPGNANELASLIKHINTLSAEEKKTISDRARAKATELSDYNVAKNYIENVLNS